ncbi:hypothetical protein BDI4_840002 [Burkholderia diffusa]|nr:hypothetical protein BDI4_840002 [Burkholderia diffusa]
MLQCLPVLFSVRTCGGGPIFRRWGLLCVNPKRHGGNEWQCRQPSNVFHFLIYSPIPPNLPLPKFADLRLARGLIHFQDMQFKFLRFYGNAYR